MDPPVFGALARMVGARGGIDAFVRVDFAGNPKCKTKIHTAKLKKVSVVTYPAVNMHVGN